MCKSKTNMKHKAIQYALLVLVNMFYASISIVIKLTSMCEMLSWGWILGFGGIVALLGIYAVMWQQVLKRVDLSLAYMFKGTSLLFILVLMALCFGEPITPMKLVGTGIIIVGIALYARA